MRSPEFQCPINIKSFEEHIVTVLIQDLDRIHVVLKRISQLHFAVADNVHTGKNLLLVSILKGSVAFMADLMRAITVPCQIDFMSVSSYGSGAKTSGVVKIIKDIDVEIEGYDILIVEDILDSGLTLSHLMEILKARKAKSIKICTLLSKPDRRKVQVDVSYEGFVIPDEFVVGYGLDFDEKYRNLPYIGVLKPEIYN